MEDNSCSEKILIVDDEPGIRDILFHILRTIIDDKVKIALAKNGEEAIEIAKRERIGGAFVDIHMPIIDGVKTCKELKNLNHTCTIIMMSGVADQEVIEAAMKCGASDFMSKPFNASDVKRTLSKNKIKRTVTP